MAGAVGEHGLSKAANHAFDAAADIEFEAEIVHPLERKAGDPAAEFTRDGEGLGLWPVLHPLIASCSDSRGRYVRR